MSSFSNEYCKSGSLSRKSDDNQYDNPEKVRYDNQYDVLEMPLENSCQNIAVSNNDNKQPQLWKLYVTIVAFSVAIITLNVIIIIAMFYHMHTPVTQQDIITNSTSQTLAGNYNRSTAGPQCTCNFTKLVDDISEQINELLEAKFQHATASTREQLSMQSNLIDNVIETTVNSMAVLTNLTESVLNIVETTGDTGQTVSNIVNSLANHDSTSISTAGTVNDVFFMTQKLLQLQNVSSVLNSVLPVSCNNIKAVLPNSPTGYSHVNSRTIYCNMDTLCNGTGGWTRIAYLDMTDSTQNCPSGFRYFESGGVRACGRASSGGASCTSVYFPANGISYSQVCGRVTGYQYSTPDAVQGSQGISIDSYYVDGVSITRGSPRQHVWTLMAGYTDTMDLGPCGRTSICPCTDSCLSYLVPSFVGSHYFCESAASQNYPRNFFASDPLWDGQGCINNEGPCCNGLPWFHRDYGNTTTTDYLELRVCGEESTDNENSPVGFYEIYVK